MRRRFGNAAAAIFRRRWFTSPFRAAGSLEARIHKPFLPRDF
jgi:hypothetical protein